MSGKAGGWPEGYRVRRFKDGRFRLFHDWPAAQSWSNFDERPTPEGFLEREHAHVEAALGRYRRVCADFGVAPRF